ncbi:amidohydrolase [Gordonia phosphorivorans]|uniref:Amidohydrolase n=1 Tax=Gordonia phosphorivorans TaxID=1056982 RepID=A0ABV6HB69_9ACTN
MNTPSPRPADRVLVNGRFYTVNDDHPWVEAVAITDGTITFAGSTAEASAWTGSETEIQDLDGNLVFPAFIDSHTHPGLVALGGSAAPLPFTDVKPLPFATKETLLAGLDDYVKANPEAPCIWGAAWRQEDFGSDGPDKHDLDAIESERPVVLLERWAHGCWLNSKALELVDAENQDPRDIVADLTGFQRDENGDLTGWGIEGAGWTALSAVARILGPTDEVREILQTYLDYLVAHGVTTLFDAGNLGFFDMIYQTLSELDAAGTLPLRYEGCHHVYLPTQLDTAVSELRRLQATYTGPNIGFRTVKVHFDGLHTAKTGALLEPYSNAPHTRGATLVSEDRMVDFIVELHEEELDLHVHCWGDQSARTMLNAYDRARRQVGNDLAVRLTLTHLPLLAEEDIPRFAELGVIASFTPAWNGDVPTEFFEESYGPERTGRVFRIRPLIESGAVLAFCSDTVSLGWIDFSDPFYSMQVSHNRQAADGGPNAPVLGDPAERLELTDLVRGYTRGAAYQLRMESTHGSIEPGKAADLMVVDRDVFTENRYRIKDTRVLETIRAGRTIYQRTPEAIQAEHAFEQALTEIYTPLKPDCC